MSLWTEEEGDCWTRFYELMLAKKYLLSPFPLHYFCRVVVFYV
jgi:hypothetical protein